MRTPFELIADCPHCRTDGAVLELYDPDEPACTMGVAAEARCRLCAARWQARVAPGPASDGVARRGTGRCPGCGAALSDPEVEAHACGLCGARAAAVLVQEPAALGDRASLEACLRRFAAEEGDASLEAFLESNFLGLSVDELYLRRARGERVETSFDAMFTLFQRGGSRGGGGLAAPRPRARAAPPPPAPASHDPRAMLLALVSVLLADGERHPRECELVDRFLVAEGLCPLTEEELVVHRPVEVSRRIPPPRRAEVVELMTQLACVDGAADPSELRLVRTYASAWGIPDAAVDAWVERYGARYASDAQRFLRRLKAFFVAPPSEDGSANTPTRSA